jgi:hypothetical protein
MRVGWPLAVLSFPLLLACAGGGESAQPVAAPVTVVLAAPDAAPLPPVVENQPPPEKTGPDPQSLMIDDPNGDRVAIAQLAPHDPEAPAAQDGDRVAVRYTGMLTDGTVFDATSKHGDAPLRFILGSGVIKGFNDGVRGMTVGEARRVRIPPALGYGSRGNTKIPGGSTIVFDITLVELEPGDAGP